VAQKVMVADSSGDSLGIDKCVDSRDWCDRPIYLPLVLVV